MRAMMTKSHRFRQPDQLAVLLLAFFAFVMSAFYSRSAFERLPHLEDEVAYLYQARIFAGGNVVIDTPPNRTSFWQPFVIDHGETGKRFGKYTPGWPALLSLGLHLGQPWLMNAFFSMVTVALVYRLGRELFNRDVGLLAALLLAFSPAALLLNASLMAHTSALFFATAFFYSYWRMERARKHALRWGLAAGLMLGALATTRPLTTVAIALPFVVWSGVRLLVRFIGALQQRQHVVGQVWPVLFPLLALSGVTLLLASSVPLFNYAATGDPSQNLYVLVWDYDRIGFGECCGRHGHTLEKGFRHARFDLSLTAADLFGWHPAPVSDEVIDHLQNEADYLPTTAYSFVLLPLGLLVGVLYGVRNGKQAAMRAGILLVWAAGALFWALLPLNLERFGLAGDLFRDPNFAWLWIGLALLWLFLPLALFLPWRDRPQVPYTWLLAGIVLGIVLVQMLYWIGSQRYSTRYYYEALSAAALLTALPLAWLARRTRRWLVYPLLIGLTVLTLLHYSHPRIMALYRFNNISRELIEAVEQRRTGERDVLVLVTGDTSGENRVRWRSYGTLMTVTSPYLDSEIVVARAYGEETRERLLEMFPDRQVIVLHAAGNEAQFVDE